MRQMTVVEIEAVSGSGWFYEAGRAIGDLQNSIEDAAGKALTTGIAWMKNSMYQQEYARQ